MTQSVQHDYLTLGVRVARETITTDGTGDTAKIMVFTYDAQGRPFAVKYSKDNGASFTNYFYALNLQGDVVKIFRPNAVKDANETIIGYTEKTYATYSYNAWGELIGITDSNGNSILNKQTTSTALANLNPLRYRGYYYDNETGFYYLQSRYYDPANRRFINADAFTSTNSTGAVACNMFAYCLNNPVNARDPSGYDSSTDENGNGIPDYLERRWHEQTIREKMNQIGKGNYLGYDTKDLKSIQTKIHYDITKEEVIRYYEEISNNKTKDILGGALGFIGGIGLLVGIIDLADSLFSYDDIGVHDPSGNVLYLEEGYTVAEIYRTYNGTKWSAAEVEYVVFDDNCTIVFNDAVFISYFYD